ncbi:MerR family transcriptional regulator [Actinoplanes sp. NBRC 101535]|uniref:MerR family transcriptional regulator n=1 Tax=Actinoplanes sp. NBRC 101535 TaxID=3032196 RepID=UPI0024A360E0|nr:MerR family transcriptional regulator [Actinoplanes sp. NBRC 101535]GLY07177.1 transcriptional regulator [Actinoplanes sp. NBRC 101535]
MGDEGLSPGAAARRLGVAVTTLRTWHQRYGLGPSRHEPGHHRRYTVEDLVRLEVMQRLTAQGVAPAEAAAWARRTPEPAPVPVAVPVAAPGSSRSGGGQTIALGPHADPAARGLGRSAMRLDVPSMRSVLEAAIAGRGVVPAWEQVIMPVLIGVGERYEATRRFIEVEHLLSRTVTEVLGAVPRPSGTPRILLSAADEEQHTLPLEALDAALAEKGVPARMLGARMPVRALEDAVARTGPAAVVLWSQLRGTGDVGQLQHLMRLPHPPLVVAAAGPGWPMDALPVGVTPLSSLTDAVNLVAIAGTVDV